MKATDLMVGDWVVYDGDIDYTNPVRIEGMDIATDMCITSDRDDVGFDGVAPIPLTAEILEKNGLKIKSDFYNFVVHFKEDEDCKLELSRDDGKIYWSIECDEYHIIELKYVHELQHALRLCKIEKEITI